MCFFEKESEGSQGASYEDIWKKSIPARRTPSAEIRSEEQGQGSEWRLLSLRHNELKGKQEDMKSEGKWEGKEDQQGTCR